MEQKQLELQICMVHKKRRRRKKQNALAMIQGEEAHGLAFSGTFFFAYSCYKRLGYNFFIIYSFVVSSTLFLFALILVKTCYVLILLLFFFGSTTVEHKSLVRFY